MSRRYASRRYAGGLGPSRIRTRIPTTRQLGQWVSLRKLYASVCDCNFPSLVASLFSWRCLAASSSSSLHAATSGRKQKHEGGKAYYILANSFSNPSKSGLEKRKNTLHDFDVLLYHTYFDAYSRTSVCVCIY